MTIVDASKRSVDTELTVSSVHSSVHSRKIVECVDRGKKYDINKLNSNSAHSRSAHSRSAHSRSTHSRKVRNKLNSGSVHSSAHSRKVVETVDKGKKYDVNKPNNSSVHSRKIKSNELSSSSLHSRQVKTNGSDLNSSVDDRPILSNSMHGRRVRANGKELSSSMHSRHLNNGSVHGRKIRANGNELSGSIHSRKMHNNSAHGRKIRSPGTPRNDLNSSVHSRKIKAFPNELSRSMHGRKVVPIGNACKSPGGNELSRSVHGRKVSPITNTSKRPEDDGLIKSPLQHKKAKDPEGSKGSDVKRTKHKAKETDEEANTSLVLIWSLITAELGFDLITTAIAFVAAIGTTTCCGETVHMGPLPMSTSIPFFFLIVAEITFLVRAILLTLWNNSRKTLNNTFCCFFSQWNAKTFLGYLNILTIVNPFFACLIAYILLYQSDKKESISVLAIEFASIILHFVSVRLEGGLKTFRSKLLHSIVLLPFLTTVFLVLMHLRKGGMCYNVEEKVFKFSGCEICPDTLAPPINGMCGGTALDGHGGFENDINIIGDSFNSFGSLANLKKLTERGAEQGEYCSNRVKFCFYEF